MTVPVCLPTAQFHQAHATSLLVEPAIMSAESWHPRGRGGGGGGYSSQAVDHQYLDLPGTWSQPVNIIIVFCVDLRQKAHLRGVGGRGPS